MDYLLYLVLTEIVDVSEYHDGTFLFDRTLLHRFTKSKVCLNPSSPLLW